MQLDLFTCMREPIIQHSHTTILVWKVMAMQNFEIKINDKTQMWRHNRRKWINVPYKSSSRYIHKVRVHHDRPMKLTFNLNSRSSPLPMPHINNFNYYQSLCILVFSFSSKMLYFINHYQNFIKLVHCWNITQINILGWIVFKGNFWMNC